MEDSNSSAVNGAFCHESYIKTILDMPRANICCSTRALHPVSERLAAPLSMVTTESARTFDAPVRCR
eukprot:4144598-Prymnesium_polylepis.1